MLELEFLDSSLIRGDSGTLNSYFVLFDSVSSINGDLVVGLISVFHAQVKILDVNIKEGQDQLFLYIIPNNSSHLITIHFDNRVLYLDLLVFHSILNSI